MDNRVVGRFWRSFLLLFFWWAQCLTGGCSSVPPVVPADIATPPTSPPVRETPTPLPTPILSAPPPGLDWPIKDAEGLKEVFNDAPVILIRVEGFLYCPPFYDRQGKIDSKVCTNLDFEVGEKQRQKFVAAIEEGGTQAGQLPEELRCLSEIHCLEYPTFTVFLLLPEFKIALGWYTERGFAVTQSYYPNFLQEDIWNPFGYEEFGMERDISAYVEFVQEKPLLYEAVKDGLPSMVFPPEYFGHVLEYERVIVEYDGKKCEYRRGYYPSLDNFMFGMLARSIPVEEAYPVGEPEAVFTFWVRNKAYPVEMWENGRFSYREKIYQYISRNIGEPEPSFSTMLEDYLLSLSFAECKRPGE